MLTSILEPSHLSVYLSISPCSQKKIASSSAGGGSIKPDAVASAKKRANLKDKAIMKTSSTTPAKSSTPTSAAHSRSQTANGVKKRKPGDGGEGHILGGADYLTLMMGSRRKAKEEAMKLPMDEGDGVAMEE